MALTLLPCPHCKNVALQPSMTRQAVEVDRCPQCHGAWLDRGEIYYFAKKPKELIAEVHRARRQAVPGHRPSPRTGTPMHTTRLFDAVEVDICPDTDGIWLDAGEITEILAHSDGRLELEATRPNAAPERKVLDKAGLAAYATGGPGLPGLSLFLAVLLAGLLLLAIPAGLASLLSLGEVLPWAWSLGLGTGLGGLLLLTAPNLLDWSCSSMFKLRFGLEQQIPDHLRAFLQRVCKEEGIRPPRIGVLPDGSPNSFSYGHAFGLARLALSSGLFDLLEPEELEAVAAHELGHCRGAELSVASAAAVVPLLSGALFHKLMRTRWRDRFGRRQSAAPLAFLVFPLYAFSRLLPPLFSRRREHRADAFGGRVCGDPNVLGRALIKIAFGQAGHEPPSEQVRQKIRLVGTDAIGSLGIFDADAARAMAVAASPGLQEGMNPRTLHGALAWERFNPWAASFESRSTHPRLAKRLERLGRQAASQGLQPLVPFHKDRSPADLGSFINDVLMTVLPGLLLLGGLCAGLFRGEGWPGLALAGWGLGLALRAMWSYPKGAFPPMAIASLLKKIDASPTRGSPCRIKGQVVGYGIPGLLWSQDLVMRDATGFLFLDKRRPRQVLPFFFGLTHGAGLLQQEIELEGWYRRDPEPSVEVRQILREGRNEKSFIAQARMISGFLLCALGLWWGLA